MSDAPRATPIIAPTAPADAIDGEPVGVGETAYCQTCRRALHAGEPVACYAYRLVDSPCWDVARLYCYACAPDGIDSPTLGALEVLASARLRWRSSAGEPARRLCLSSPTVGRYAPPSEGAAP